MKILIYLPVYNDKNRVERAVKSVLNQNYKNWELIISDNKSNDGTHKILLTYLTDKRINYILLDKHVTSDVNFNNVENFLHDRLDYRLICFLASDDYWVDENYLKNLVNVFLNCKDTKLVIPVFNKISKNSTTPVKQIKIQTSQQYYLFRILKLLNRWETVNLIYGLYKRDFFLEILTNRFSRIDIKNKYCDWWWAYLVLKKTIPKSCSNSFYFKDSFKSKPAKKISRINNLKLTFRFMPDFFRLKLRLIRFNNILDFLIIFTFALSKNLSDLFNIIWRSIKRILKV